MIDHLSSSQLNLYQQCSLKYKFRYIDGLPVTFKSAELAFGSAIHSALAWFHEEIKKGSAISLEQLLNTFSIVWHDQKGDAEIRYKSEDDEAELELKGLEMMSFYFNRPNKIYVKGAEVPFRIPIINSATGEELAVPFEGFIDLIEKNHIITEFKTSGQTMNQEDIDNLMQLTIYDYAYEALYKKRPKLLNVVNFVKTKTPKIMTFVTERSKEDHIRFFNIAKQVLAGIMFEIFFPTCGWWCKTCEYSQNCGKWNG